MIAIRKATRDDIPALCALERECFSMPWVEKSFEDFFSLDFTAALAAVDLSDGKVVGYAGLYRSMNEGDITNIAVTASMRRKGVGLPIFFIDSRSYAARAKQGIGVMI